MNPEVKTALEHIAYVMLRSAHSRFRQHARDIRAALLIYGDHEMSLAYWKLAGRHARTWRIVADKALNH